MSNNIAQFNEEIIKGQIKKLAQGSVEEALIEMYPAGVSVHRAEDITQALQGSRKYLSVKHLESIARNPEAC